MTDTMKEFADLLYREDKRFKAQTYEMSLKRAIGEEKAKEFYIGRMK